MFGLRACFSCCIALCLIPALLGGCAVNRGPVYTKNGKVYRTTKGLFKSTWDDFYQRGISYSEGGYWEDAANDFRQAISRRPRDQRRARTYGMHFIDYFPHRELGIAYYNLGQYKKGISLLEASLASIETSRAKFYLNRARKAWLQEQQLDRRPPDVAIQFPPPGYRTNRFRIPVEAQAEDDYFVSEITVNGKSNRLELTKQKVSYRRSMDLRPGTNTITLQSVDILGASSKPAEVSVHVDREGPLVFLSADRNGNIISVTGAVYDSAGVAGFRINGRSVPTKGSRFRHRLSTDSLSHERGIRFCAEDTVGNSTGGIFMLHGQGPQPALPDLEDGLAIYREALPVQVAVSLPVAPGGLLLNGFPLVPSRNTEKAAALLKELSRNEGLLACSRIMQLHEGENSLFVTKRSSPTGTFSKTITVTRKIPAVHRLSSRMSIVVLPFHAAGEPSLAGRYIQTVLSRALHSRKRFHIPQAIAGTGVALPPETAGNDYSSPASAARLAAAAGFDTVLVGTVHARGTAFSIDARLIDSRTAEMLTEQDIYWEGSGSAARRVNIDRLARKFSRRFPLCGGTVVSAGSGETVIDVGSDKTIPPGMAFYVYREAVKHDKTCSGFDPGGESDIRAQINVAETAGAAERIVCSAAAGIAPGDLVLAK